MLLNSWRGSTLFCDSVRTRTYVLIYGRTDLSARAGRYRCERAAAAWLLRQPAISVFVPFGHSPDTDPIAIIDDRLTRVQVKTSTVRIKNGRYQVSLATRGGNQSWSGLVKRFSSSRCDFLFVLVADGRQWFIPSSVVEGSTSIIVGGPRYAAYEVDRGRPFEVTHAA